MIQRVQSWFVSDKNVFTRLGCTFEIMCTPEQADTQSITVEFDLNNYFCRLTFWASGQGHIEVLDSNSEETIIDEPFDVGAMMSMETPFEDLTRKLAN